MELKGLIIVFNSQSWASLWLIWWRICPQCWRPGFDTWVGKIPWEKGKTIHSGILAWEPMNFIVHGMPKSCGHEWTTFYFHFFTELRKWRQYWNSNKVYLIYSFSHNTFRFKTISKSSFLIINSKNFKNI